jgi:NitT/TauT family transport system ATP-binding protein
VRDNVLLPVSLKRSPTAEDRRDAEALLARLGLATLAARRPSQLSGGQQARAALARALILRPPLLLLDEPFAALDAMTREDLQDELLALCGGGGTSALFVTHDIGEAIYLGDKVALMERGRIAFELAVDLPRPRRQTLRHEPAFNAFGKALREAMEAAR